LLIVLAAGSAFAQTDAGVVMEPPGSGSQPGALDGGQPIDPSTRCQQCHDRAISDPGDPLYMPYDGWASTMMGNSMRDPLFQAAVAVANQDVPGVGSWCYRCHSPQSYVRGDNVPADGSNLDDIDRDGVTCDVCHRAVPNPQTGQYELGNAQIFFERANLKYGPYGDVLNSAHVGTDAGFTSSSELCGNCHEVLNPLVQWKDSMGNVLGPNFPLDTTYDEWKQSQFSSGPNAKTCQDCHMPRLVGPDGGTQWYVAKFGELRDSPRQHFFVGGNVWGLSAVQANDPAHAAPLSDQFAQTTQLATASLQSAADLSLTVDGPAVLGDTINVHVRVTNKTGHKLPTGYADGRRMVLQLLINGEVHTGAFDGGELGADGWLHEYRVEHGRAGVGIEDHLALHDMIVVDSRIPPAGFNPPPGAPTRPRLVTWFDLPDGGFKNWDDVTWNLDVPSNLQAGDTLDFVVRLLYQSTTPEYVGFLQAQNTTTDAGNNLVDIFHATGDAAPIEMARAEATTMAVAQPGTGGGGAATGGGSAATGGGSAGGGSAGGGSSAGGGGAVPGGGDTTGGICGCSSGPGTLVLLALFALKRRRVSKR
jgi:uncharacterized membrane protein YgcG